MTGVTSSYNVKDFRKETYYKNGSMSMKDRGHTMAATKATDRNKIMPFTVNPCFERDHAKIQHFPSWHLCLCIL